MIASDPTAFDAFASDYDDHFTRSRLGRLLRTRVWAEFDNYFSNGQRLLELACGTGEDAVRLARRGLCVTATDGSAEMIRIARAKAEAAGVSDQVEALQLSMQQIIEDKAVRNSNCDRQQRRDQSVKFDGVYANFGGLNTIFDRRALARTLSELVKPQGIAVFVLMGPVCPWELVWYLGHGQPATAFRRFRGSAMAEVGASRVPIWYPSAKGLAAEFAPWFQHCRTASLGLWLPPSYLDHFVDRWPRLFSQLDRFERTWADLTGSWGDHYIMIFQRRG